MNRITIDTDGLRALARTYDDESNALADIRLDLLRAWSDVPLVAYPGVERLASWADEIGGGLAQLAGLVTSDAASARLQALRADDGDVLGQFVSLLFGCFGALATAFGAPALAAWIPMTSEGAAPFGGAVDDLGSVGALPTLSTGVGGLDPFGTPGAENGALAPISGILDQVGQLSSDPFSFLDGPQGQALAASEAGAVAPIQGLLDQANAIIQDPLGFSTSALGPSAAADPLTNAVNSALQGRINGILAGDPFAGSGINIAGAFGGNSPANPLANLGGFVNGLLNGAPAGGGSSGGGGFVPTNIAGQFIAQNTSNPLSHVNFFGSIIGDNESNARVNADLAPFGASFG